MAERGKRKRSPNMATTSGTDDDLKAILSEQREELVSAQTLESDLNFAFNLQMQEAITASLSLQSSSSSSSPPPPPFSAGDDDLSFASLVAQEFDKFEQEFRDTEMCELEIRKMRDDLNRRTHDHNLAREISRIPEHEWRNTGDHYQNPYNESVINERFRVYVKGLVSEERVKDSTVTVAALGVAICDSNDYPIFELKKPLVDGQDKSLMSGVEVGIKALIEGLNAAIALDLKKLDCYSDEYLIYQYVTGQLPPPLKISELITDVQLLRAKCTDITFYTVPRNDIMFASKLAREAIVSQITWPSEIDSGKNLMETCVICFDDTVASDMFSVDNCMHRFCFSCMKQHMEVKMLSGVIARCPHDGCESQVNIDTCINFLDPKLIDKMRQRTNEASIPVTEKVYCPYPKCSVLMSKKEVLDYTNSVLVGAEQSGARKCTKCRRVFCIKCKVPWHDNMTCSDYKRSNQHYCGEDAKLKSLATRRQWRQCVKCNHLIELGLGCYHIYCRCGYEFCYICGAEWKNKKATCNCPLWEEPRILYNDLRRRG